MVRSELEESPPIKMCLKERFKEDKEFDRQMSSE